MTDPYKRAIIKLAKKPQIFSQHRGAFLKSYYNAMVYVLIMMRRYVRSYLPYALLEFRVHWEIMFSLEEFAV